MNLIAVIKNWRKAGLARKQIDSLFSITPSPQSPLRERLDWFADLIQWIRSEGYIKTGLDFSTGAPQAARVKYALLILEKNVQWKVNVAGLLRSLIQEAPALELFMTAGIPDQSGVLSEFLERLQLKFVPSAGEPEDLSTVFSEVFRYETDSIWIQQIDPQAFLQVVQLFQSNDSLNNHETSRLKNDAQEALYLLAYQVSAMGLHTSIRQRAAYQNFREVPFFQLPLIAQFFLEKDQREKMVVNYGQLKPLIKKCQLTLSEVYSHMDEHGVGVDLVYQLDRIETSLNRMTVLADLLCEPNSTQIQNFVSLMVAENVRSQSVMALITDSFSMISRKISETSAETGEHYITRTRQEYGQMFKRALGGGLLTGVTTLVKFLTTTSALSPFFNGLVASLNYSLSFISIQLMGFTLATKQPAMTAASLASQIKSTQEGDSIDRLTDEIFCLIRSQIAAVIGNIVAVIPAVLVFSALSLVLFKIPILGPEKALKTLKDFSILGMTPIYAAFTGVLLFVSSLSAGWINNWMTYRRIPGAIARDRRLIFALGKTQAESFSVFFKKNIAGFAGNITLALLLGLTPVVAQFFGLPLDVRHVTLSTGSLTAAMVTLGSSMFKTWEFWLAVAGILSMACLNLAVSFFLAMTIAIRAKKVRAPKRRLIYSALWRKWKKEPLSLFIPEKSSSTDHA